MKMLKKCSDSESVSAKSMPDENTDAKIGGIKYIKSEQNLLAPSLES